MSATLFKGLSPHRTTLPNGAVVTVQETSMTPAVTLSAAFRPGSLLDPHGLEGLAYLMGRVLDRGTERRKADEIAEALDDRGVSLKISTNRQAVTLSCTLLSEDFDDILALLVDVVRRPVFPDEEIEKGRAEAVTTLRQNEDNPGARAADGVMKLLYTGKHPYGRPSKGTVAGVERVTRGDITSFHRERIVPAALSLQPYDQPRSQQGLDDRRPDPLPGCPGRDLGERVPELLGSFTLRRAESLDPPRVAQRDQ